MYLESSNKCEEMKMKNIVNTTTRTINYRGIDYGPGAVIEVSGNEGDYKALASLAKALKLTIIEVNDNTEAKATAKKSAKKTAETAATAEE